MKEFFIALFVVASIIGYLEWSKHQQRIIDAHNLCIEMVRDLRDCREYRECLEESSIGEDSCREIYW